MLFLFLWFRFLFDYVAGAVFLDSMGFVLSLYDELTTYVAHDLISSFPFLAHTDR